MISLIFATHNGAASLPRMLGALLHVERPKQGLEILAVNNASDDDSQSILEEFTSSLPMNVLVETRKGKSFALNKALEVAQGDLIVFTDDDVIPSPEWLLEYEHVAARWPDVGFFAGQVRHEWDKTPPAWLEYLAASGRSYGGTPIGRGEELISPGMVKGANMMVRRLAMTNTRFCEDPNTNFSGQGRSMGGEDTKFAKDVSLKGHSIVFAPGASVRHIVKVNEVGLRPVFARYYRIGRTMPLAPSGRFTCLGYSSWGLRLALREALGCILALAQGRTNEAADNMVRLAKTVGGLSEGRRRGPRPSASPRSIS